MEKELRPVVFTKRKDVVNRIGDEMELATNFFRFKTDLTNTFFYKYAVDFDPVVPGDSAQLRRIFFSQVRTQVEEQLGFTLFNNTMAYCQKLSSDAHSFLVKKRTGEEYTMRLKFACDVQVRDPESLGLFKRFVDRLVKAKKFINFRKNLFDPSRSTSVQGIEIWPGFNYIINHCLDATLLNLNMIHRVLRPESALQEIKKIRDDNRGAPDHVMKAEIKNAFANTVVLTRYCNDKTYIISDVDFDMNPQSTFDTKEGPVSFLDYYFKKYNRKLTDIYQPLLVHIDKKKDQKIYLMPELCFLTGLTDEMRANFNLMKGMNAITKPAAEVKLKEGLDLIKSLLTTEKAEEAKKQWKIDIDMNPVELTGRRLHAGSIFMLEGKFDALADDIDRKVQQPMLISPALQDIKIICNTRDSELASTFMDHLFAATKTFKYQMNRPDVITVNSNNFKDWENAIKTKTSPSTRVVVLILQGGKGKGQNYNELKRLLKTDVPIPSQCVLANTLKKDKGLRSVVNKILIQICAKVGGEPWGIEMNLPFTSQPTMIMGIDVYEKRGTKYIGCAASFNKNFTQFFSLIKETESDVTGKITECIAEALAYVSITYNHLVLQTLRNHYKAPYSAEGRPSSFEGKGYRVY
jgi:aubergine-like protein